jgi:hypothetical protein
MRVKKTDFKAKPKSHEAKWSRKITGPYSIIYLLCRCGLLSSCGGGGGGGGEVAGEEDGLVHTGIGRLQVDIEGVAGGHSQRHRVSPVQKNLLIEWLYHWLINYIDPKANFVVIKKMYL